MKGKKIGLMILIVIIPSFILVIFFSLNGTPWGKAQFKSDVKRYLEQKYLQEMVLISDVNYSFELGTYSISVSPTDFKDIKFAVWQTQGNRSELGDNYYLNYWMFQVNNEFNTFLRSTFVNNKVSGKVVIQHESVSGITANEKLLPPNYDDVKDQLKNGTYIFIEIDKEFNEHYFAEEYSQINTIFNFVKEKNYRFDIIKVNYKKSKNVYFRLNYTELINVKESRDLSKYLSGL